MKEKDYKKLYEDVVALAKDGLKDGLYLSQSAKAVTEFLFPQLKETEDEKVRRELVTFLINFNNGAYSRPSEDKIDSWIKWIDKKANDIEKQCEQKAVDEVKQKFKVGDWITDGEYTWKVTDIKPLDYILQSQAGSVVSDDISYVDEHFHLWTIQDANDGDVLAFDNSTIVIFKDLYNSTTFHSYCHIGDDIFDFSTEELPDWWEGEGFKPATKEQRDLFFSKMKEAGYEWDAEKKELKIIDWSKFIKYEPNSPSITKESAWSEEDEKMLESICNIFNGGKSCIPTEYYINWLKSLKDRVQPQPKQEWSEEDSERLLRIHQFIWANRKGDTDEIYQQEQDADWLMSIIPQPNQYDKGYEDGYSAAKYNQWKPKKEELEALRKRTYFCEGIDANLDSLYTNLLKL